MEKYPEIDNILETLTNFAAKLIELIKVYEEVENEAL